MMSWELKKNTIISQLEKDQSTLTAIREVVDLAPSEFNPTVTQQVDILSKQLSKQIKKLKNNEFHVAIVGLEKSGKSTFLNAWLGCDILPNQAERCTYTTTEIRSSKNIEDQRMSK
jgi:ribosome biogenesis GTPase A